MKTDTPSRRLCRNILHFTFGGASTRPMNRINPIRSRHLVLEPLIRQHNPKGWSAPVMDPAAVWRMACGPDKLKGMDENGLRNCLYQMQIPHERWDSLTAMIEKLPNVEVVSGKDEFTGEDIKTYREVLAPTVNEMQSFAPEYTEDYAFSTRHDGCFFRP